MKITFVLPDDSVEEIETTMDHLAITPMGVRYFNKELQNPMVRTFDKLKGFKIEGVVTDDVRNASIGLQNFKSDKRPKRR